MGIKIPQILQESANTNAKKFKQKWLWNCRAVTKQYCQEPPHLKKSGQRRFPADTGAFYESIKALYPDMVYCVATNVIGAHTAYIHLKFMTIPGKAP